MKRLGLIALGLGAAFIAGRLTLAMESPAPATHERIVERQPIHQRVVNAPSSSLTADEVRAIVSDALANRAPTEAATKAVRPTDPVAFSDGQAVVASGIADGRWSNDDRERLREVMPRLDRDQHREVIKSLLDEIKAGRVKIEADGSPL